MPRMTDDQEKLRESVENPQFRIGRIRREMELSAERVGLAIEHNPSTRRLLIPVLSNLLSWIRHLGKIQREVADIHAEAERRGWK